MGEYKMYKHDAFHEERRRELYRFKPLACPLLASMLVVAHAQAAVQEVKSSIPVWVEKRAIS